MEKKLKIALLSYHSGLVDRGVETYVHELSNRLVKLGHDITVFQGGKKQQNAKYKTETINVKGKEINKWANTGVLLNQFINAVVVGRHTLKVLKKIKKDTEIIVATNNRFQALFSKIWCLKNKSKLIISGQGGPGLDERLALYTFPDVFIPLSSFQQKWAKRINPFIKVSNPIPNGVDISDFRTDVKFINFNLPHPIVLCVAALWPSMKRQELLIKAMSKLNKGSLLLVGSGEGKNKLQKLGDKLLEGRFKIASFPFNEMPRVYPTCDLFSFPTSTWEAFGIVLVEAMASGLPVVATDDPIRREIVGEAGIFVDPTDTEAYSKALEKALNTNWGEKPRIQAEKFDWDKIALKYENVFHRLL